MCRLQTSCLVSRDLYMFHSGCNLDHFLFLCFTLISVHNRTPYVLLHCIVVILLPNDIINI